LQIVTTSSSKQSLIEILQNNERGEKIKPIPEESKRNLSPGDIAVEPDSSESSRKHSLNDNADLDNESFNTNEFNSSGKFN